MWICEKDRIKDHAIQFFSSLYSSDHREFRPYPHPNCFHVIDEALFFTLQNLVGDDEIKTNIFGMHLLKAPGPDDLHTIFYHIQWTTMGPSFCKLVKDVFNNKHISGDLNSTLLVLILKLENPASLKMSLHISLCNVAYKTITKVIVNRQLTILPQLDEPH